MSHSASSPVIFAHPCHNCRRRRLRCDRSRPICHKCVSSGRECLGYDKVFIWTGSVAIRGKMSGRRSFGEAPANNTAPRAAMSAVSCSVTRPDSAGTTVTATITSGSPTPAPALTDPAFRDLDGSRRRYLFHFANRVCKDLVAHDHPGSNPFRDLIPLAAHHAFLLHILVATSAVHFSNITRPRMNTLPSLEPLGQVGRLEGVSEDVELSKTALIESLAAKQQAIRHLRIALDDAATIGNDVLLAGILFFVNFELIYVGKSVWRTHLNGAREIMMSLCATWSTEPPSRRRLRDCVVADCLIYHILGSTLSSTDELASSISNLAIDLLPVLERTEASCYLCCPAAILRIILASSQLANAVSAAPLSDETISYALGLMKQALSFDIHAWATSIGHLSTIADAESREHVASAHRSAAALYIPQAIPTLRPLGPVSTDELVVDILEHLSRIGENDAHFKATTWPTFIVGAETRDPDKRAWVLRRLLAVWESCPWGYIVTAIETLRTTWKLQDERPADVRVSWLEELRELNFDCLVI